MAKEIIINQYTSGLVRIDDLSASIPPGLTVNVDSTHCGPFWVATDYTANGEVVPRICLPPSQTLIVDGEDVAVNPLEGERQEGQLFYVVPKNIDIWCAGERGANGQVSARLYTRQNIPGSSDFAFRVALVPEDPKEDDVEQYTYGTVTINSKESDKGSFAIVRDSGNSGGVVSHHFSNCYYMTGGMLNDANIPTSTKVESFAGKFVCLKVPATTNPGGGATIEGYSTIGDVQTAQQDPAYFVTPLYKIDANGKVEADLRNSPTVQVAEII